MTFRLTIFSTMTPSKIVLTVWPFGKMTHGIQTLYIMTHSVQTLIITTFIIMTRNIMTLSINDAPLIVTIFDILPKSLC